MNLLAATVLGVVQGATEFLPVSSSAHLILARMFFGWDAEQLGLSFDVSCHVGTLVALLIYFRRDVRELLMAIPQMTAPASSPTARLAWMIVAATVPVAIVGLLFNSAIEDVTRTPAVAATALAVGGALLLVVERVSTRVRDIDSLTVTDALIVGAAQALALVPGVSRAGATITAAMFLGFRREAAARFSFLLGIVAIVAAAAHEAGPVLREIRLPGVAELFLVGAVTSLVVGYVVIKYFMRYLQRHSLDAFGYYRLEIAAVAGIWLWTR